MEEGGRRRKQSEIVFLLFRNGMGFKMEEEEEKGDDALNMLGGGRSRNQGLLQLYSSCRNFPLAAAEVVTLLLLFLPPRDEGIRRRSRRNERHQLIFKFKRGKGTTMVFLLEGQWPSFFFSLLPPSSSELLIPRRRFSASCSEMKRK